MVQFLSISFFSWISSIFVGFFKSSRFFVSLCISFYCNFSRKNIPYKTACTNGLPDDEHMLFETRRRHKELNENSDLKGVILLVNVT